MSTSRHFPLLAALGAALVFGRAAHADSTCVESPEALSQASYTELWTSDGDTYALALSEDCCQSGAYNFMALQVVKTAADGRKTVHQNLVCDEIAFPKLEVRGRTVELVLRVPNRFGPQHVTRHLTFTWDEGAARFQKTGETVVDVYADEQQQLTRALGSRDGAGIRAALQYLLDFHLGEKAYQPEPERACALFQRALRELVPRAVQQLRAGKTSAARETLAPAVEPARPWLARSPSLAAGCLRPDLGDGVRATLVLFNDFAYALDETGQSELAIHVLRDVLTLDSRRTVAYLNLSDAYARLGKTREAAATAAAYAHLMGESGKAAQVPARAMERASSPELGCPVEQRRTRLADASPRISFECPDAGQEAVSTPYSLDLSVPRDE